MAKKEKKIRIHNQGQREYTIRPAVDGGKERTLKPNRAVEIEESTALKMLEAYPQDLIEFDSLVSGEKQDLTKENASLQAENEALKEKLAKLEATESKQDQETPKTNK